MAEPAQIQSPTAAMTTAVIAVMMAVIAINTGAPAFPVGGHESHSDASSADVNDLQGSKISFDIISVI